LRKHH